MISPEDVLKVSLALKEQSYKNDSACLREPLWRSSTSRAYYAAFHSASQIGDKCPEAKDAGSGSHQVLIKKLIGCPLDGSSFPKRVAQDIRRIGYWLNQLKADRVEADYIIGGQYDEKQTDNAIHLANKILRDCSKVISSIGLSRVV